MLCWRLGRGPRLLDPFRHSTILASEVFKEASWGAMRVVVVGEQAAGSPTFSPAPAWAGTLQGEEGKFKPCPMPHTASLFLSPGTETPRGPRNPSSRQVQNSWWVLSPGRKCWLHIL